MLTQLGTNPIGFVYLAITLVVALTVHEFSHAWAAFQLGDDTAERMGRLTLNPLKHLDPLGTIIMLAVGFGWAEKAGEAG